MSKVGTIDVLLLASLTLDILDAEHQEIAQDIASIKSRIDDVIQLTAQIAQSVQALIASHRSESDRLRQ